MNQNQNQSNQNSEFTYSGHRTLLRGKAAHGVRAARNHKQWGLYATWKYVVKHGCINEYRIARQLEAVRGIA